MKVTLGKKAISMLELSNACGGFIVPSNNGYLKVNSVCTDSREAGEGVLFCAMRGERVDGHDYIGKAFELGCRYALCERIPENADIVNSAITVVPDTVKALNALATVYSADRKYKTVAITGSVGKTTTKEFIATVLPTGKTYKTKGNYNSTIGLPLSVLEIPEDTEFAVLEMGMSGCGEIELMSNTARPDIAVITNVGTAHLEHLGTRENIRAAKLEIISGMDENGILLINGDDDMLGGFDTGVKTLTVGINKDADFRAVNIKSVNGGMSFDIETENGTVKDFHIPTVGNHNIYAALFAYAVATLSGIYDEEVKNRLYEFEKPKMRQNIFDVGGITIIEDCYNASPESMRAALDVLSIISAERGGARTVALLGNMLELGENTAALHRGVGEYAAEKGIDKLFTYGDLALNIAIGANIKDTLCVSDISAHELTADILLNTLKKGDILLVKASRGVAAEKIIEILKERLA